MLVSHISLCFIKKTKCSLFFLQLWLKPDKARTSRSRKKQYSLQSALSPLCILWFFPTVHFGFQKVYIQFKMQPTFRAFRSTGDFVRFPNCKSWTEWESGYNVWRICSIAKLKRNQNSESQRSRQISNLEPEGSFPKSFLSQAPRSIAEPLSRCFSLLAPQ